MEGRSRPRMASSRFCGDNKADQQGRAGCRFQVRTAHPTYGLSPHDPYWPHSLGNARLERLVELDQGHALVLAVAAFDYAAGAVTEFRVEQQAGAVGVEA